jgi:hypothetical protein
MATDRAVQHYTTLATQASMPRFQLPANDPKPEAPSFDSEDIVELVKYLGATRQDLDDLDVMLASVIEGVRQQERYEAMLRTARLMTEAVDTALRNAAEASA